MRLTRRNRRWLLLGAGGAVYLTLFVWLLSPLWRSPAQPQGSRTPVHRLAVRPRLRLAHLPADAAVPSVMPGSSSTDGTASGGTGAAETASSESTYEATPEPEVVEETAASPTQSAAPETGGGETGGGGSGGGESKTVIGFEG
jgi:hypothetical protein